MKACQEILILMYLPREVHRRNTPQNADISKKNQNIKKKSDTFSLIDAL